MSLQSNINTWKGIYDNTGINAGGGDPSYIGSVIDVNGNPHVGAAIYTGVGNKIYDFNVYAGQGVTPSSSPVPGGKFLLESTGGFSWDTVSAGSALAMQTSGSLNNLYLGTSADTGNSPLAPTVTAFDADQPLLVIKSFNIVSDYAATLFGGSNGNSSIALSQAGTGAATGITFGDLMAKPGYYASATFNSAVTYNLAFEENALGVSTFEWLACESQRSPAPACDPAPIQTTKLPGAFGIVGELPHNLGSLPITRKMPILASKLGGEVAGLGHTREPETTAQFSAKAHAPNYPKNTRALAYNALHSGARYERPAPKARTAATCVRPAWA